MKQFSASDTAAALLGYARCGVLLLALSGLASPAFAQSFRAPVIYAAGDGPQGIAAADVNGDGRLDLVVVNSVGATVSVFLSQGTIPGAFSAPATTYNSGGSFPVGVAIGDVNLDGRPDIVLTNQFANTLSVLLHSGATPDTFLPAVTYSTQGSSPRGIALGDVNGDGLLDALLVNRDSGTIGVLLNSAMTPGTFLGATTYPSGGTTPDGVAVGDLNGDGRPDIVASNRASSTLGVLLNSATAPGTFSAGSIYASGGTGPRGITVSDLNKDGRLDIVTANFDSNTLGILLGSPATPGTFLAASSYAVGAVGPDGVAVGDVNGDGRPDVLVGNYNGNYGSTLSILLNSATVPGTFPAAATTLITGGGGPLNIALRDYNGDGRLDIAITNFSSNNISVLLNAGTYLAATPALAAAAVHLYPNPAHEQFTLELPGLAGAGNGQAELLNPLGQVVRQQQVALAGTATHLTIITTGLAAGMYTLRLQAGETTLTKRVAVE